MRFREGPWRFREEVREGISLFSNLPPIYLQSEISSAGRAKSKESHESGKKKNWDIVMRPSYPPRAFRAGDS